MRIAQIVTYISPDGAYGGPVRVAESQCAALARRGHEVTLWAAAPVDSPMQTESDGYIRKIFPARRLSARLGFAGMWGRKMVGEVSARARSGEIDVSHVHLARDLVSLPAASALQKRRVPVVAQPHGMVLPSGHRLAGPVDRLWTRPVLRNAKEVLALTSQEEAALREVERRCHIRRVNNGIELTELPDYTGRPPTVLFLARLHARKRPMVFLEMAKVLRPLHPELRFVIAGPDEGELASLIGAREALGLVGCVDIIGAVAPTATDALLRQARAYVLPSVDEVFPMTMLEAFRAGTPTVTTDSLGILGMCRQYGAALDTDGSAEHLAAAVSSILTSASLAERLRRGGRQLLSAELDVDSVALELEGIYRAALEDER